MRIEELTPDSAAAKAGLKTGDVVTAISGKRFKTPDDYLDATAQAAGKPTYSVEFVRNGKKMTAVLQREFRPAITQQVVARNPAPLPPSSAVSNSLPSLADELGKLAKLRDTGVLTDAEFEEQKRKLLAR